jgi:hypothetical protein
LKIQRKSKKIKSLLANLPGNCKICTKIGDGGGLTHMELVDRWTEDIISYYCVKYNYNGTCG